MTATVLVVDDEDDIRLLTKLILEGKGNRVVEAPTAEDGLAALDAEQISWVLLDLRLPGIDGWEFLRRLREHPDHQSTPVVIMSAHSSPRTLKKAAESGTHGYLIKPFTEADLLRIAEDFDAA
ncbi:MAG: response regulator [Actinomycetota bacterium]